MGTIELAELRVLEQLGEHADEGHGGRDVASAGALAELLEERVRRRAGAARSGRRGSARGPPSSGPVLLQIDHLRAVLGRPVERRRAGLVVGDRDPEAGAELAQLLLVELLLLVGDVAAFAGLAEAVALDRLGEDHGRASPVCSTAAL